jgi:hypothetical protein
MYAVEFEAQVHNHTIMVPDSIPEGADICVLLWIKEVNQPFSKPISDIEARLLKSITPYLAHADELVMPLETEWSED